ncbi:MAG: SAM-dependent methyltransferase [Pseudomonadota bacterium]
MASNLHLNLPIPDSLAQDHSQQLSRLIQQKIEQAGGWIDFYTFMQMALYTPSLGYYSGGALKFADNQKGGGDFVTAPQISPLFARTLARQAAQVLNETKGCILELGAGTGKLAADLMLELQSLEQLPAQYFILEVSDYLRQIQLETLQKLPSELFKRIVWLDALPVDFVGLIIGNEVLDAVPVYLVGNTKQGLIERGVGFDAEFIWQDKPLAAGELQDKVNAHSLPIDYLTEVCPAASGLISSLAASLKQGVILMLDYGFGAAEYYHPQRNTGTLMCHYQHYAHSNPLIYVGLQDITAHVNFTAIAEAGVALDLSLAGYCNQASFLMNCGLLEILSETSPNNMAAYAPLAAAAQKLLSPAEMGELFKVIALSKDFDSPLIGFKSGDKAHML